MIMIIITVIVMIIMMIIVIIIMAIMVFQNIIIIITIIIIIIITVFTTAYPLVGSSSVVVQIKLEFRGVGFCGRRETGEKPLEQGENQQQTQPT